MKVFITILCVEEKSSRRYIEIFLWFRAELDTEKNNDFYK